MKRTLTRVSALLILAGCATAAPPAPTPAPDTGKRAIAAHGMVAAAHPLASEAGLAMLRSGGNAIDAAVATAFAIGVVEPMMSGIGGSGGLMIWDQAKRRAEYLDFYATAPAGVSPEFDRAPHPARIVAVPGAVAGLLEAHERYGRLPREQVLAPAIRLAEEGFPVGSLLARTIADDSAKLGRYLDAQRLFWPDHRPLQPGERLVQRELAATLRRIAAEGRDGFHRGPVAEEIVRVLNEGGNPITTADLAGFTPRWRRPVCAPYRRWTVLSAPPPQSGVQIVQALRLLEPYDLAALGLPTRSSAAFHLLTGALRTASADRAAFMADPDAVGVPAHGIASAAYAAARRAVLDSPGAPARIGAGDAWAADREAPAAACERLEPYGPSPLPAGAPVTAALATEAEEPATGETTHLSAVDAEGNAVALTYTQGVYFGSGAWAAGTFLNSGLANFSANPASPNVLAPGRIPTSTTTPTIILDGERVRLVVGSPGAARIPPAVTQAIVYILDYGMDPLEALRMPRIQPYATSARVEYEQGFDPAVIGAAREIGYRAEVMPPASLYFGGVHVIDRRGAWWIGAADPRRDGEVRGY